MATAAHNTRIAVMGGNSVFGVPERVAHEDGLFERHGIDIDVWGDWDARNHIIQDPVRDPLALFESGTHDTFNMCEWGVLRRIEHVERPAHIVYIRPAIVAQALVSFDDAVQEPHDLAGVTVGINETTGQHFTTLKILEGSLKRDEIKLEHGGDPEGLLRAGQAREYAAVTLMEPYISLALHEGGHVLAHTFYRGAQAFADTVPEEGRRAYIAAVNEAVDIVNADPERRRAYVNVPVADRLPLAELRDDYYRYVHAQPYSRERFDDQYTWLTEWGLAKGGRAYEDIIDATAAVTS